MASQFPIHIRTDLDRPLMKYVFSGAMFSKDNKAHIIDVTTYSNNQVVAITGTVEGVFRRNDGKVIGFEGSISGGKAVIELPDSAYEVDGPLTVLIRNSDNGVSTVIGYMSAYVNDSGNAEYGTGGTYVISIAEIQEKLDELDPLIARLQTLDVEDLADITTKLEELDELYDGITEALEFADLKVNKPTDSPNGTAGQMLRTKGDGTTEWADVGTPTDAQATSAINAWLTAHPEATTTVQDKSITKAKLDDNLQVSIDDVDRLKSAIGVITGNIVSNSGWRTGYYVLNNSATTVDIENPTTTYSGFVCTHIPCNEGDIFYVTASGSSAARQYGFLSNASGDNNIISKTPYTDGTWISDGEKIVAPANAQYLIVNSYEEETHFVVKNEALADKVNAMPGVYLRTLPSLSSFGQTGDDYANLSELPPNTFVRTINAPDRPEWESASSGLWVLTLKSPSGTQWAQAAFSAKTGKIVFRYAGSGEYSDWTNEDGSVSLKMLCIGNSFTQDNLSYLPFILKNIAPNIDLTLGFAYYSGGSIDDYKTAFENQDSTNITYYRIKPSNSAWINGGKRTLQSIIVDQRWDIITFQQVSTLQESAESYGNLNALIDDVVEYYAANNGTEKPLKLGWLMPQIRYSTQTADSFKNMIRCLKDEVLAKTPIDVVFPCGTAIENARGTELNSLGDGGALTVDGAHLQEGLPCMIGAYAAAIVIADLAGEKRRGILGEKTRPTDAWVTEKAIPGVNGSVVGVSDTNCYLAQKCAVDAVKSPYAINGQSNVYVNNSMLVVDL